MPAKTIIFDFGGVLVDWNPRYLYKKIFSSETEMEWFLSNVCTPEWNQAMDAGKPFAEGIAELCERFPGFKEQISAFYDRWPEMLGGEITAGVGVLSELKAGGYRLYGLTNWSAETIPVAYSRFDFLRKLDGIVVSGEEKVIKPDPEIFRILLKRYHLKPEDCIFIDDNQQNTEAADALGFETVLFSDATDLRNRLRSAKIEIETVSGATLS